MSILHRLLRRILASPLGLPVRQGRMRLPTWLMLGGLLCLVALAIVASLILARRMVTPIRALQEGAARIGAGALDQRIDVRTGDELERLGHQFNRMAAALSESYATLEQKVVDRTREPFWERTPHQLSTSVDGSMRGSQARWQRVIPQHQLPIASSKMPPCSLRARSRPRCPRRAPARSRSPMRAAPGSSGRSPALRCARQRSFHAGDGQTDASGGGSGLRMHRRSTLRRP